MGVELTILNSFHSQRGRGSKDHFLGRGPWDLADRLGEASNQTSITGRPSDMAKEF